MRPSLLCLCLAVPLTLASIHAHAADGDGPWDERRRSYFEARQQAEPAMDEQRAAHRAAMEGNPERWWQGSASNPSRSDASGSYIMDSTAASAPNAAESAPAPAQPSPDSNANLSDAPPDTVSATGGLAE